MERYEKYKPTGIEWIGKIPEHWDVKKIKHRCYVKGRVGWNGLKSSEFLTDGYSYLITGTDFKKDVIDWKNCYHIDEERYLEDPFIQLRNEDLLITKDGTIGKLAVVTNLEKPACLNSGIFVVRSLNPDLTTRFLFWVLKSKSFTQFNDLTAYGSTIQHLYQNVFVELAFAFPLIQEQYSIAIYLDRKTAEIDQIIANKQKLIALYEEEKQAVINHAVTRGLDPNVHLKPSGVEWLGDIPEHWNLIKLKRISNKITDGEHISPTFTLEGMPFLSAKDVRDEYVQFDYDKFVNFEEGIKFRKRCNPEKGDVLIVSRGATVGRVAIVETNEQFCLLGSVILVKPISQILNKYLLYSLKNKLLQDNFLLTSQSSAQQAIYLVNVSEIHLSIPLINEQQFIVAHIEKESNRLDTFIEKCKKQIELLKEYRTTLISEVVTGKVKSKQLKIICDERRFNFGV